MPTILRATTAAFEFFGGGWRANGVLFVFMPAYAGGYQVRHRPGIEIKLLKVAHLPRNASR